MAKVTAVRANLPDRRCLFSTERQRTRISRLCALAPWAEALGAAWIRVFDGPGLDEPLGLGEALRWLGLWSELRDRNGWRVTLAVETHDSLLTSTAINRLVEIASTTPIVWDAHHTWKLGREDPSTTWARCSSHIVHLHIKDSRSGDIIQCPTGGYVLPGDGEFPAATLLDTLRQSTFTGAVVLEWERLWHPRLPSLEEAVARARTDWGFASTSASLPI